LEPKVKQSDDLYIREGISGWLLSYNINEYGKIIVKAIKTIEATRSIYSNDESKIEFTIETPENKTPRIKT
jgi:hypothetical protein